jgi:hypothetical protein
MGAAPAFGGPVRLGDESAPFDDWSVEVLRAMEDVVEGISAVQPVLCAWPVVGDGSMPDFQVAALTADLVPTPDFDRGVRLSDDLGDCGNTTAAATPEQDSTRPQQPEPSSRLRSAVQTLGILSALAAVVGLGWLVAALTRRAGRASRGLRWYR